MAQGLITSLPIREIGRASFKHIDKMETLSKDILVHLCQDNPMKQVNGTEFVKRTIRPVRQSASKDEFLKALNLDLSLASDRQIFAAMWEEVTHYWVKNFETDVRDILKTEYRRNMGVKQPYKWGHLSKEAIDRAIHEIWETAGDKSRWYYDHGHSADLSTKNWVLKWLLWHVSRYRDERNNKKNRSSESSSTGSPRYSPLPGYHLPLRAHDTYLFDPTTYRMDGLPDETPSATPSSVSSDASTMCPEASLSPTTLWYSEDMFPMMFSVATSPDFSGDDDDDDPKQTPRSSDSGYWKTVMDAKFDNLMRHWPGMLQPITQGDTGSRIEEQASAFAQASAMMNT